MITQFELLLALSLAGYAKGTWGVPKDLRYSAISVAFIEAALREWLNSLPAELVRIQDIGGGKSVRLPLWVEEAGDCDNIAWDFCAFLNRCMWVDAVKNATPRGNTAAGVLYFNTSTAAAHAIVWFIDHEQKLHHVDPGSMQIDHLSPTQIGTIFGGEYA